jgi:hypothetical protein
MLMFVVKEKYFEAEFVDVSIATPREREGRARQSVIEKGSCAPIDADL